jgi:hypothetical protein
MSMNAIAPAVPGAHDGGDQAVRCITQGGIGAHSDNGDSRPNNQEPPRLSFHDWRDAWLRQVLGDRGTPPSAKTLTALLFLYLNSKSRMAFPGIKTLNRGTRLAVSTIYTDIAILEERGHMIVHRRHRRSNRYEPIVKFPIPDSGIADSGDQYSNP